MQERRVEYMIRVNRMKRRKPLLTRFEWFCVLYLLLMNPLYSLLCWIVHWIFKIPIDSLLN
jgi:hypothetical protein